MYGFEPPLNLIPDWVASLETCSAIDGVVSKMGTESSVLSELAWTK